MLLHLPDPNRNERLEFDMAENNHICQECGKQLALNALEAENNRLQRHLSDAAIRLEWCAGLIKSDSSRDRAAEWADEANAARIKRD